jgi:hypothetical protein
MSEETISEIKEKTRTSFKVSAIPVATLKRFQNYCEKEAGDVYWVGISQLLNVKEKYDEILSLFYALQKQIDYLSEQIKQRKEIRTFG